jgi:sulfide dehydrogenase cytochrome subunit
MGRFVIACALLLGCAATAGAADEVPSGRMLANTCAGCHGTDGRSPGPIPPIHGMSAGHIASAMRLYKNGQRPATVMDRIARGYSDREIERMSEYLAGR